MSATPTSRELLAINGGTPVRKTMLPYGRQFVSEDDIQAVVQVLRSDWLTTGPKVREFEEAFASCVGVKYAVSFSSGTAALHAAAFAAGLKPGDEAITSPITFAATADTLNLDPEQTLTRITPRTRAVLPVDYSGHPADLDPILRLAEDRGLTVIEDASHALGAEYKKRYIGSISHMTTFSFHPVKHLTTGEGGMVTTGNPAFAETLRRFRNHGISSDARERQSAGQWFYEMVLLGFNYRLTDIACALGISQLHQLEANLACRRKIAAAYTAAFRNLPGVVVPSVRQEANPAWHLYAIRLDFSRLCARRAEVFRALRAENIGVNVHYIPVHLHPYYRMSFDYKGGEFPVAEEAYERLISLPIFHGMTDEDARDVIRAVTKIVAHFGK